MKKILIVILAAVGLAGQTTGDGPQFTADGQLTLPKDYRQWVFLSSGLGMTYGPAASADPAHPLFAKVFVNPSSYRAFIETGHWPDKTMFVLRNPLLRRAWLHQHNAGHYQDALQAIEAEVKDEARFPQKWRPYFGFGGKERSYRASRQLRIPATLATARTPLWRIPLCSSIPHCSGKSRTRKARSGRRVSCRSPPPRSRDSGS